MFLFIACAHLLLILFALYRMTRREGRRPTAPYAYTPRTSMVLASLFKGRQETGETPAPEMGDPRETRGRPEPETPERRPT